MNLRLSKKWFSPVYFHIRKYADDPKVRRIMIYGGKGSAKTFSVAQMFQIMGYTQKQSAIVYRKEQTTIKTTLKPSFQKALDSIMCNPIYTVMDFIFRCVSGNEIVFKGLDTEGKVKGIEGYKYLLFDELDHYLREEWNQANISLRGMPGMKLFATWNPVSEKLWIKGYLDSMEWDDMPLVIDDDPYTQLHHNSFVRRSKDGKTILIKTTYFDNKWAVGGEGYGFLDQNLIDEYEQLLLLDPNSYRVNVLGDWGVPEVSRPYCQNFSQSKHVSELAVFNPQLPVYFSLDFNVEPFVCEASHIWNDANGMHFHTFDEIVIEKNGDVPEMCDMLENMFGLRVISNAIFTGDAMQRKREITQRNNIDAWRMIDAKFNLGRRLQVPRANPSVKENRHLVNAILAFHPDVKINPKCKKLIYDMQFVEADEQGDMIKKSRSNEKQRADALDAWRYKCNTFLADFFERYRIKK